MDLKIGIFSKGRVLSWFASHQFNTLRCGGVVEVGCIGLALSIVSISVLGFFVWVHHMFVVGFDADVRIYFSSGSITIAVPTSIKIFNWLVSVMRFDIVGSVPYYAVLSFALVFIVGGITGLILANCGLDVALHDSYFVAAHFHFALSISASLGSIGSLFVWIGLLCGKLGSDLLWSLVIWYAALGSLLVFYPLYYLGLLGYPRRASDHPVAYSSSSFCISVGMLLVAMSVGTHSMDHMKCATEVIDKG